MSITCYKWDIFLSYASADNEAVAPMPGWVTHLHDLLKADLRAFVGGDDVKIFFDKTALGAGSQLPELEDAASQSAVFVAVASRAYAKREYTNRELEAFINHNEWQGRLFVVERMAPSPYHPYPPVLATAIRRRFHEQTGDLGDSWLDAGSELFRKEVKRLASEIGERLLKIQAAGPAASPTPQANGATKKKPCVLLAETCQEMERDAAAVRRELQDIPVTVLPESPYPEGADAFRKAYEADLRRADLVVQLLGSSRGWMPRGMPEGTVIYQARAAMAAKCEILQWWPEQLRPENLPDETYRQCFDRDYVNPSGLESLKRCTLESFRAVLVRRLTAPRQAEPFLRPGAPVNSQPKLFIHHDLNPDDWRFAAEIQAAVPDGVFEDWSRPLVKWSDDGTLVDYDARDTREKMRACTTLILVNGNTTADWVGGQLKIFLKLKGNDPAPVVEVIVAPPEKGPRDDHGQRKRWLKRIPVRAPLNADTLRPVIDTLRT